VLAKLTDLQPECEWTEGKIRNSKGDLVWQPEGSHKCHCGSKKKYKRCCKRIDERRTNDELFVV
jgi:uncharacterized protein YchJ